MAQSDQHSPGQSAFAALRELWRLVGLAGPAAMSRLRIAITLTSLATLADIASLILLQRGVARLASPAGLGLSGPIAGFLAAALIATTLRLFALRQTVTAQYAINQALCIRAFRALQMQDYAEYLRHGASAGFTAFERLNLICYQALSPIIGVAVSAIGVAALSLAVGWLYPLAGGLVLLALLLLLAEANWRNRAPDAARVSTLAQTRSVLLYEARSAFRDVYLTNGQQRLCSDFAEAEAAFRSEQARTMAAAQASRHTVELAGLGAALALLATASLLPGDRLALIPAVAVLALAALRLLPQFATLRTSLQLVALHGTVTDDVLELLSIDRPAQQPATTSKVALTRAIRLEGVTVARADRVETLRGLDLTIARGARIGIRGASGTGKSTLLDVICGAVQPTAGAVWIDEIRIDPANGANWRERIGVVSQAPILLGRTLRDAVVFPERFQDCDSGRFEAALSGAGIAAMVAGFEHGLDTEIGEALIFLSGGQRQRLAFAHALYRAKDLLILDEATGQLDADSEAAIVAALADLPRELTVIVVSHREALFAGCEQVYELAQGRIAP